MCIGSTISYLLFSLTPIALIFQHDEEIWQVLAEYFLKKSQVHTKKIVTARICDLLRISYIMVKAEGKITSGLEGFIRELNHC